MSEQHGSETEHIRSPAQDEDDLLSSEPQADAPTQEPVPAEEAVRPEGASAGGRKRSGGRFLVVAWALVVVLAVFAALVFAELVRVSKSVNEANCIARAQAAYNASNSSKLTTQQAGLASLALRLSVKKCGS